MLVHLDLPLLLLENVTEKRQHWVKQISWLNLQVQEQSIFFCDFKQSSYYFKYHCHVSFQAVSICLEFSMYVKQCPNIFHLFAKKRPHWQKQTSVVILLLICLNKKPLFGIVSSWNTNIFNFVKIIWHLIRTSKKRNIFCYMDSVTKTYFG